MKRKYPVSKKIKAGRVTFNAPTNLDYDAGAYKSRSAVVSPDKRVEFAANSRASSRDKNLSLKEELEKVRSYQETEGKGIKHKIFDREKLINRIVNSKLNSRLSNRERAKEHRELIEQMGRRGDRTFSE